MLTAAVLLFSVVSCWVSLAVVAPPFSGPVTLAVEYVTAFALIAGLALNIAEAAGAFEIDFDEDTLGFDALTAGSAADVELQAAQRRADQRRNILAGEEENALPQVGFATTLGTQKATAPTQPASTTLLGS